MPTDADFETIYKELDKIEQSDALTSAISREKAQDILATPTIALKIRKAVADYLYQINQQLTLKTVTGEDSY